VIFFDTLDDSPMSPFPPLRVPPFHVSCPLTFPPNCAVPFSGYPFFDLYLMGLLFLILPSLPRTGFLPYSSSSRPVLPPPSRISSPLTSPILSVFLSPFSPLCPFGLDWLPAPRIGYQVLTSFPQPSVPLSFFESCFLQKEKDHFAFRPAIKPPW